MSSYTFFLSLLVAVLLGNNIAHADIYKCVSEDGKVAFRKSIFSSETCKKIEPNTTNKPIEASQLKIVQKPNVAAVPKSPDFNLICEEIEFTDFRLFKTAPGTNGWTEGQLALFESAKRRNETQNRPYFAMKYIDGKLSLNKGGITFLANETPNQSNSLGWTGRIEIDENSILLDLKSIHTSSPRMRTILKIDRYTGLYEDLAYAPDKEEPDYGTTGRCTKYNEKLF